MTDTFRALCAELIDALDSGIPAGRIRMSPLADRARALLAQPVEEGPTVMEILELHTWLEDEWRANNDGEDLPTLDFARAVLARWGRPTPQPVPERADIHYAWELLDEEGDWQAGGSANSLDDVQREGNRYLQTYSQDGPHKLIIQRHCVTTLYVAIQAKV